MISPEFTTGLAPAPFLDLNSRGADEVVEAFDRLRVRRLRDYCSFTNGSIWLETAFVSSTDVLSTVADSAPFLRLFAR